MVESSNRREIDDYKVYIKCKKDFKIVILFYNLRS